MTKRLIKTKADHRKLRAMATENEAVLTLNPAAGALTAGVINVAHVGVTFTITNAVGGTRGFDITEGAIPTGMVFAGEAGTLTGTPTAVETAAFTVRGTDEFGNTGTAAYTLDVAAA